LTDHRLRINRRGGELFRDAHSPGDEVTEAGLGETETCPERAGVGVNNRRHPPRRAAQSHAREVEGTVILLPDWAGWGKATGKPLRQMTGGGFSFYLGKE